VTSGRYRSDTEELDRRSVCRKTGVSPEAEMDIVTGVELEYSYGAGDGRNRSGVASMPKERSGGPRLDQSCNWEKYGYDSTSNFVITQAVDLSVKFPASGDVTPMTFYLTLLDSECMIVLGHN